MKSTATGVKLVPEDVRHLRHRTRDRRKQAVPEILELAARNENDVLGMNQEVIFLALQDIREVHGQLAADSLFVVADQYPVAQFRRFHRPTRPGNELTGAEILLRRELKRSSI